MSASLTQRLHRPGDTPVHRLPAHVKLVGAAGFVVAVVATPPHAVWAFAAYAGIVLAVATLARVPLRWLGARLTVELPFVIFALALPFVTPGEQVAVPGLPVTVSSAGLWAAWALIARATAGVAALVLLSATTPLPDLIRGLERLRVPGELTAIMAFMIRYVDIIAGELSRMRIARASRGFEATGLRSWPTTARTAGALFVRSYERGERVHLAMLSRGYAGRMPVLDEQPAGAAAWRAGLGPAAIAGSVAVAALMVAA